MSTDTVPDAVLVTGASRGIGAAIARRLAGDYHVINLDIAQPATPSPAEFVQVDLRDLAATRACLTDLTARHRITRLVNNVDMSSAVPLAALDDALTDASIALNLRAALLCLQAVLPAMTEAGFGRVVNMGSRTALGKELRTVYSATKGGMHALTRTWALELAGRGIAVNGVAPGMIDTELFRGANPPDSPITQKLVGAIPMKRLGTPDDVAKVVAFLLSDGAAYMTGQIVHICGGLSVGAVLE